MTLVEVIQPLLSDTTAREPGKAPRPHLFPPSWVLPVLPVSQILLELGALGAGDEVHIGHPPRAVTKRRREAYESRCQTQYRQPAQIN